MIELKTQCNKGHQLNLRITEVREDDTNINSKIVCWLLYGICDKCQTIVMQGLHQEKIEPTEGIDYVIIDDKVGKTVKR